MTNIVGFPNERGRGGGGGPEDPGLEERVKALEAKLDRIADRQQAMQTLLVEIRAHLLNTATRSDVVDLRSETAAAKADLSYIKGRVEGLPSTWQMIIAVMGSWAVGVGAVVGLLAFIKG